MKPKRTFARAIALVLCGAALGACGEAAGDAGSNSANGSKQQVVIRGIKYQTGALTVEPGTTVTWTNQDPVRHTVTSGRQQEQGVPGVDDGKPAEPDGTFDGDLPGEGDTFEFTFEKPGAYAYYCDVHAGMTAEITVE